jgi:hypothetical protein
VKISKSEILRATKVFNVSSSRSTATKMAEYDLSKTIIPYLDRHLAFPLLAHLLEVSLFPTDEVIAAQYALAKGTNMFDYASTLFVQIYPGEKVPSGKVSFSAFSANCNRRSL